jgi:hypothetical protein
MTTEPAGPAKPGGLLRDPRFRLLLDAVVCGVIVGVFAVFGWARETPEALGFFTFTGVLIGGQRPPARRGRRRDGEG